MAASVSKKYYETTNKSLTLKLNRSRDFTSPDANLKTIPNLPLGVLLELLLQWGAPTT